MRVDGSDSGKNSEVIARIQDYSKNRLLQPLKSNPASGDSTGTETPPPAEGESGTRANGALRLLEEGHFKGVPALRLSINFAEEIQAANGVKSQEAVDSGVTALQDELNETVASFKAETELTPEQVETLDSAQQTFNTALSELADGEEATDESDIFGKLRTAFQDFLNSLVPPQEEGQGESIIPVQVDSEGESVDEATETPATPAITTTTADPEPADINDVFAGLRDTLSGIFEPAISNLEETVTAINQPAIPEPEGNGRAYEKFLATYNEIYGAGTTGDTAPEEEGFNTIT